MALHEGQEVRLLHPFGGVSYGHIESIRDDAQTLEDHGEPLVGLHITTFKGRSQWTDLWYLPLSQVEQSVEAADVGAPTAPKRKERLG